MNIERESIENSLDPAEELNEGIGKTVVGSFIQSRETLETSSFPMREYVVEQLDAATESYRAVVEAIYDNPKEEKSAAVVIAAELNTWLSEEKLSYINTLKEADSKLDFTLLATPNLLIDYKVLTKIAKAFGDHQPHHTYVWEAAYNEYTPQQLSGTDPDNGNKATFSLVPNSHTPGMYGRITEQGDKLARLQVKTPYLKVPSLLEAVTYWNTLRAQNKLSTDYNAMLALTAIRHFDLPEKRPGRYSPVVPGSCLSCVSDVGRPAIGGYLPTPFGGNARIAVG